LLRDVSLDPTEDTSLPYPMHQIPALPQLLDPPLPGGGQEELPLPLESLQEVQRRLIDHLEVETGQRRPATASGIIGVLLTPGNAFLVFVYTQIISVFGYDGATKLQSINAPLGIRLVIGLMPAIMIALGLFFPSKYPINKDKEDEIETEMLTRHKTS